MVFFWQRRSPSLVNPAPAGTVVVSEDNTLPVVVPSNTPYVDPLPHDKDRDGLTDTEEQSYKTSDQEIDTDHDGMSDVNEIRVWHTDPLKTDTDDDGFSDSFEIIRGYNPLGSGKLP